MVFRDYKVRCKRCRIPYNPKNVSRIKTCVFCRKCLVEDKKERIEIIHNDILRYYETQGVMPTKQVIMTWIKLKFELSDAKVNEYFKIVEKNNMLNDVKVQELVSANALNV